MGNVRVSPRAFLSVVVSLPAFTILLPTDAPAKTGTEIAHLAFPSVILLVMEDPSGQPMALASGFVVAPEIVATNFHVIEGASGGHAKLIGQEATRPITGPVAVDAAHDLALLSVTGIKAPPLSLSTSGEPNVGDPVYAVGNPEGLEGTFSQGIISGVRKTEGTALLQITAAISPGSSGGPVLDERGGVVGVALGTFETGQSLNFAIPTAYLRALSSAKWVRYKVSRPSERETRRLRFPALGLRTTRPSKVASSFGLTPFWPRETIRFL
jgi:S1-C subfamily serine protease